MGDWVNGLNEAKFKLRLLAADKPGLGGIAGRHLEVDLVADVDADEMLEQLAGDLGEDFMAVGQRDAEHGARQDLGYFAGGFDGFFLCHWARAGVGRFKRTVFRIKVLAGEKQVRLGVYLTSFCNGSR